MKDVLSGRQLSVVAVTLAVFAGVSLWYYLSRDRNVEGGGEVVINNLIITEGAPEWLLPEPHNIVPVPELPVLERALLRVKTVYVLARFGGRIRLAAKRSGLDWKELAAIVVVESSGNPEAVSSSGAIGLMQVKPSTGRDMGIKRLYHPYDNLCAGARYLKYLKEAHGYTKPMRRFVAYHDGPSGARRFLAESPAHKHFYARLVAGAFTAVREVSGE